MGNALQWVTVVASLLSAIFAILAFWVNRERLRLDLYNRRFDVYVRTLNFFHALNDWRPSEYEKQATNMKDSRELQVLQNEYIKASRESQFLFSDSSGIHKLLEQIHTDTVGVIGYLRDVAPHSAILQEQVAQFFSEDQARRQRILESLPILEEKLAPYLDFHSLSTFKDMDY